MKPTQLIAAVALSALISAPAAALTPETTTLVSDVSLSVPSFFEAEETTTYVGIQGCGRMAEQNSLIGVTFGTTVDTTLNTGLYEGVFQFDVERDSTARYDCESDACAELDPNLVNQTSSTVEVELDFEELTTLTSEADCSNLDREYFVRLQLRANELDDDLELADARIIIDTVRPTAPTLTDVTATESLIRVEFTPPADEDLLRYQVVYSTEPFSEGAIPSEIDAQTRTFGNDEVESGEVSVALEPGQTVYVGIASQDEAGNLSPVSTVTEKSVIETTDFWEAYKQAGGSESGGCSQTPGAPTPTQLVLLLLGGLVFALRRGIAR